VKFNREFNREKWLVAWLNGKGDNAAKERVASIARDIRTLACAQPTRFQLPTLEGLDLLEKDGMDEETLLEDLVQELKRRNVGLQEIVTHRQFDSRIARRLDSALSQYAYRPYVNTVKSALPTMTGTLLLQMIPSNWEPPSPKGKDLRTGKWLTPQVIEGAPSKIQEAFMVYNLVCIAQAETIDRIRQCKCGKWFLAMRTDKHFCGEDCRKKFHVPTEEQRKNRREWNREYQRKYQREYRKLSSSRGTIKETSETPRARAKKGGK
jgi:hypothetical protein